MKTSLQDLGERYVLMHSLEHRVRSILLFPHILCVGSRYICIGRLLHLYVCIICMCHSHFFLSLSHKFSVYILYRIQWCLLHLQQPCCISLLPWCSTICWLCHCRQCNIWRSLQSSCVRKSCMGIWVLGMHCTFRIFVSCHQILAMVSYIESRLLFWLSLILGRALSVFLGTAGVYTLHCIVC